MKEFNKILKLMLKNKQFSNDCYNFETHDCDGSCQGCSGCSLAQYIKKERKNKPSDLTMFKEYYFGKQFECMFYGYIKKEKIINE